MKPPRYRRSPGNHYADVDPELLQSPLEALDALQSAVREKQQRQSVEVLGLRELGYIAVDPMVGA